MRSLHKFKSRYYRICRRCGCALDPGEGTLCEECEAEMQPKSSGIEKTREVGLIHAG